MSRESNHTCHALNCEEHVPPRMHMCRTHWYMVPKKLRDALWAAYRPGQERTMSPSPEYLRAAAACIESVAVKESYPAEEIAIEVEPYLAWATMIETIDEPELPLEGI